MNQTVQEILEQIQKLPEEDRLAVEEQLAKCDASKFASELKGRDRYPLRGSVVRFERPTEAVAEDDWEAGR